MTGKKEDKISENPGAAADRVLKRLEEISADGTLVEEIKTLSADSARRRVLDAAIEAVCADRNLQYGEPENNFSVIGDLWTYYTRMCCVCANGNVIIGAREVAELMILFKLGRLMTAQNPSPDSYTDIAGYAACCAEIVEGGKTDDEKK